MQYLSKRYYAVSYWDESLSYYPNPTLAKTGISDQVDPNELWSGIYTPEYIHPENLQSGTYYWFDLAGNGYEDYAYSETSSRTWSVSASASVPFAISYSHFGVVLNLDVTVSVTSGFSNDVYFEVDRRGEPDNAPAHRFYIYTPEFSIILNPANHYSGDNRGGVELHIWDMGVPS